MAEVVLKRHVEDEVETLELSVKLGDEELDAVFGDPANALLYASAYSPTVEKLSGSQKTAIIGAILTLVEKDQATALGLSAGPEQKP